MPEYQSGYCTVEHAVAKKLKALVVRETVAAMSECLVQQFRLVKGVAKLPAKCITVHILISRTLYAASQFSASLVSASLANSLVIPRRPTASYFVCFKRPFFSAYQPIASTFSIRQRLLDGQSNSCEITEIPPDHEGFAHNI